MRQINPIVFIGLRALILITFALSRESLSSSFCDILITEKIPEVEAAHVSICTPLEPMSDYPPTSGTHFDEWAKYKIYDQPVTPGFWLHSMEHGAIVILYNCPTGCPDEVRAITSLIDSLPRDGLCEIISSYPVSRRIILAPDRNLASKFAMISWGWSMQTNCLNLTEMRAFYDAHYAKAPEDLCGGGSDYSTTRWCNEEPVSIRKQKSSNTQISRDPLYDENNSSLKGLFKFRNWNWDVTGHCN